MWASLGWTTTEESFEKVKSECNESRDEAAEYKFETSE